jgi:uncharacterized protein (TIGR02246 family)
MKILKPRLKPIEERLKHFKEEMIMNSSVSNELHALYQHLMDGWNNRCAQAMAEQFTEDGEIIGFDGSLSIGREEILSHLKPIFGHHLTAPFVSKVKSVCLVGSDAAILRAIAGMVPHGQSDVQPNLHTHHTLVAVNNEGKWLIQLFQNTPAQFHGRPELVEQMTEELRQLLK